MFGWQDAIIVGLGASLIGVLKDVPKKLIDLFFYQFTRKIVIYDDEPGFGPLCNWLSSVIDNPKSFRLNVKDDRMVPTPGLGAHYFFFGIVSS